MHPDKHDFNQLSKIGAIISQYQNGSNYSHEGIYLIRQIQWLSIICEFRYVHTALSKLNYNLWHFDTLCTAKFTLPTKYNQKSVANISTVKYYFPSLYNASLLSYASIVSWNWRNDRGFRILAHVLQCDF